MNQEREEAGFCVVCGRNSTFAFDPTIISPELQKAWPLSERLTEAFNRKESLFCSFCGSSLRIRRLCAVLLQTLSELSKKKFKAFPKALLDKDVKNLKIAEINACKALHTYLKEHPNLHYSEFFPHTKPGETFDEVQCEDLQTLTYPNDYFDIILTSETMEHVPNPDKAWREIHRTLKKGRYHIFTIPIIPSQQTTVHRATIVNGKVKHNLEPVYHGEWGQESMFVYTDFGMDIIEKLNGLGLSTEVFYFDTKDELDVALVFRSRKFREYTTMAPGG